MKICFQLQRRFAYVGHKLALTLKQKYGITEFYGYVYLRSSFNFLQKQKDVNYTSLLLDEDIHNRYKDEPLDLGYIKKIEKEYGLPNLWPYIALDRIMMYNMLVREYPYNTPKYSHEEMMRIFQVKAKAIIEFFEKEKPDVLIISVVGAIGSRLLYQIAKKRGIKVLIPTNVRIDNGSTVTDCYETLTWVDKKFELLQNNNTLGKKINEARDYIKRFQENPDKCLCFCVKEDISLEKDRFKEIKWFLPKNFFRSLRWFFITSFQYFSDKKYRDYEETNPFFYFLDRLKRKFRTLIGYKRFYKTVDVSEDYAYFPLNFEPEIAVLLYAPFWTDQINLIRQIAQSLPLHFKLYVKDHPGMTVYRPWRYYRELNKIPNVKLIQPSHNSFDLIKNSKLITAISGTTGWEGILLKKPVITFGETFYNKLSAVNKCEKISELPILIKKQLENFKYNQKEVENYVCALMEESIPTDIMEIWIKEQKPEVEQEKLTLLADLIMEKISTKNFQK